MGRWEPRKGSAYLPGIIEILLKNQVTVRIVGADPFSLKKKSLQNLMKVYPKTLKVENLISDSELSKAFMSSTIVIIPSIYESFGLVAIEAMAHGCGIVAFSGSGIEESISDSENARLVPIGDTKAFANAAINLLQYLGKDPKSSSKSISFVRKNYEISDIANQFIEALRT